MKEAIGLRARGHEIVFAVVKGGKLVEAARREGFTVYEIPFSRRSALSAFFTLRKILKCHAIQVVNTHSSWDAWIGGIAARSRGCRVVRTRHLSTPVKGGLNAFLLYRGLADFVVTTSSAMIPILSKQAGLSSDQIRCVPTGVSPVEIDPDEVKAFRLSLGVKEGEILVGTVCVVRSWKGIQDLIAAARILKHHSHIKWVVVGGGYLEQYRHLVSSDVPVIFTGHLENPFTAMAALDIFMLLSTAHEGISQASLQAAELKKPLITTGVGGLPEVCIDQVTGILVAPHSPDQVAKAVLELATQPELRHQYGKAGHRRVREKFMMEQTLDQMERILRG